MAQGSHVTRMIGVDATAYCPHCATTVPLAGPVLQARCHACGQQIPIAPALWTQTLGEADDLSFDAGASRTAAGSCRREHNGVHLGIEWSRQDPVCRRCGNYAPLVEPGTTGETTCESCSAPLPTFVAPPWLRNELPTALQVYGVEYVLDAAALDSGARRWWIAFHGTPARKAVAHELLLADEIVVMSQRMPRKKESKAYLLPIMLVIAAIAFASYYVVTAIQQANEDPLLQFSE